MPGRLGLWAERSQLERRFGAEIQFDYEPRYNITPESDVPTITNDDPDTITPVEWGFVAPWDETRRLINARSETVAEKRTFEAAFAERRCLLLASGYYEWQAQPGGPKQPYLIRRSDDEPFAFAGLWNPANGYDRPTCTILTTVPSSSIEHIHDRMPVILEPDEEQRWLETDAADGLQELLDPSPADHLDAYPISTKVNDPTYDQPDVIEPVAVGDQSGLGDFS